ncbi:MAG: hypothetical protein DHS80DRAFT_6139, partial [Piptocephalis tieghemiana]
SSPSHPNVYFPVDRVGDSAHTHYQMIALWPLPPVTFWVTALTLLVSLAAAAGFLHPRCSAPSYVLHQSEYGNLLLSPFWSPIEPGGLVLAMLNLVTFGLFEESLAHLLGGTRRFALLCAGVWVGVSVLRQLIGWTFSVAVGWAIPYLFFSDSAHECSHGLGPFLFALLIVQSLSAADRYIVYYGTSRSVRITLPKTLLQLALCMLNTTSSNILWWSLTGLLTGILALGAARAILSREERVLAERMSLPLLPRDLRSKLRRALWVLWPAARVGGIAMALLLAGNLWWTRAAWADPEMVGKLLAPEEPYLMSLVVMTAPRPGDPDFLIRTVDSFLSLFPESPQAGSFYDRVQLVVYTHFSNHTAFDQAVRLIGETRKGVQYVRWLREGGKKRNQRLHLARALRAVVGRWQSAYVGIIEDDMPLCGKKAWAELVNIIWEANRRAPSHCGVFVGTGG